MSFICRLSLRVYLPEAGSIEGEACVFRGLHNQLGCVMFCVLRIHIISIVPGVVSVVFCVLISMLSSCQNENQNKILAVTRNVRQKCADEITEEFYKEMGAF